MPSRPVLVAAALALAAALGFAPPFVQFVLTRMSIAALFALGFNLVFGYAGVASLGHAAFYALGAYAVALASARLPHLAPVAIVAAPVGGALLGVVFAVLTRRTRGIYTLLLTLMLAQGLWGLVSQNAGVTGGDTGIAGIVRSAPFESPGTFGLAALTALLLAAFAAQRFVDSPPGLIVVAGRESEARVAAFGFDIVSYRAAAFALSGAICAFAGVLHAYAGGSVTPLAANWSTSAGAMVASILGGPASILGPAIGAASLVLLETVASSLTQRWETLYGLGLIATIVFMPRGLLGLLQPRSERAGAGAPAAAARLDVEPAGATARAGGEVVLDVANIRVTLDGVTILRDCSLALYAGERVAIVGPNGAGKSTLFAAICGDVALASGTMRLCGSDVSAASPDRRARAGLGRTYQFGAVPRALSVRAFLELAHLAQTRGDIRAFVPLEGMSRLQADVTATLERTGLAPLADLRIGSLSAGTQRVVEIVGTLAAKPRVLLLDEPTAGLDESERALVVGLIAALPRTIGVLVIEHDREVVEALVDRVGELGDGRIKGVGDAVALGT
jgi:branched-chain amino acid transport system permease protein